MPIRNHCLAFAAFAALAVAALGQSVVSTRAGLIHYFEGAVYVGSQRLESHLGTFSTLPQDAELRTAEGKAELLLTPDVFLRVGDRTSVRMLSDDLADTRVELEAGSVIVDSERADPGTSASVVYKNWRIHFLDAGVYRIDSDPPRLLVSAGKAEVFTGSDPQPVALEHGMNLPLAAVLVPDPAADEAPDSLTLWSKGRDQSITADNAILAQLDQDPGDAPDAALAASVDPGFTYYPMIGLMPPLDPGVSASLYSSLYPVVPGFYSMYLPGYTYVPLFVGLMGPRAPLGRISPIGSPIGSSLRITHPSQPLLLPATPRPLGITTPRIGGITPRVGITPSAPVISRPSVIIAPRPAPAAVGRTPVASGRVGGRR